MSRQEAKKPEASAVAKMAITAIQDSERWFGHLGDTTHSIPFHVLALAGEVGELANLVKKVERGDLRMGEAKVRHAMAMELTDCFIYLLLLSVLMDVDLEKAYQVKRAENENRFGGKDKK
jgi:NTP pyrophosphatase (non-canonical NTP hydrolase)